MRRAILLLMMIVCLPINNLYADKTCCEQDNIQGEIIYPNAGGGSDDGSGGDTTGAVAGIALSLLGANEKVLRVGQTVEKNNNQISTTIIKNFENQNMVLQDLLTGLGMSDQKMDNQRNFGKKSQIYMADNDNFSSDYLTGKQATGKLSEKIQDDLNSHLYIFNQASEYKEFLDGVAFDSISKYLLKDVLPNENIYKIKESYKANLAPMPPLNIKESKTNTKNYDAIRKVYNSKKLMPISVIGDFIASKAKTMPLGDWKESVGNKMGVDLKNEDISKQEFYTLLSDSRFANTNWTSGTGGIHDKTYVGTLREMLNTKVSKLKMDYQRLLLLNKIVALYAQKVESQTQSNFSNLLNSVQ